MAIYHFSGQIITRVDKRGKMRSSVACAAYRSAEKLFDERSNTIKYYPRSVKPETIILVPENAPEWAKNRNSLWNAVEKEEKQYNSQLAREFNVALPCELTKEQQRKLAIDFCQTAFVDRGMVADICIHRDNEKNPHFHVMLTMRKFDKNGQFMPKCRKEYVLDKNGNRIKLKSGYYKSVRIDNTDWNNKENLKNWRKLWAYKTNLSLSQNGFKERIDYRSYKDINSEKIATLHEGSLVSNMRKRGLKTEIGDINDKIKKHNDIVTQIESYKAKKRELENVQIYRCFSPSEKQLLCDAAKELKILINKENIEIRKGQLERWKKSLLFKDNATIQNKLDRIEKETNILESLTDILEKEARRFVNKYYPQIKDLSNNEMLDVVDQTVNKGKILDNDTIEGVIIESKERTLNTVLNELSKDSKLFSINIIGKINELRNQIEKESIVVDSKTVYKIDKAKSGYHIYQGKLDNKCFIGKFIDDRIIKISDNMGLIEARKKLKELVSHKNNDKFKTLDKYERAFMLLDKFYDTKIRFIYPNINVTRLSMAMKEQIIGYTLYFGSKINEQIINQGVPNKYSDNERLDILELLSKNEWNKISAKYSNFIIKNETYKNMFLIECLKDENSREQAINYINANYIGDDVKQINQQLISVKLQQQNNVINNDNSLLGTLLGSLIDGVERTTIENEQEIDTTKKRLLKKYKKRHLEGNHHLSH